MSTPASIARHPIHPILVGLPIGLWTFSVVADVIYALGWGGLNWKTVAFYCIGGGIVTALIAAVPGFIDFLSISDSRVWRVGVFHMAANLTAVVVYAVSFGLRWAGNVGFLPVAVSIVGADLSRRRRLARRRDGLRTQHGRDASPGRPSADRVRSPEA